MPQLLCSSLRRQFLWGEGAIPPFDLHYLAPAHIKRKSPSLLYFPNSSTKLSQCAQETGRWQSGQASSIRARHCKDLPAFTQAHSIGTGCAMSHVSAWRFQSEILDVQVWVAHHLTHSMNLKCEEVPSY